MLSKGELSKMNVSVRVTELDIFQDLLGLLAKVYDETTDPNTQQLIEEGLNRIKGQAEPQATGSKLGDIVIFRDRQGREHEAIVVHIWAPDLVNLYVNHGIIPTSVPRYSEGMTGYYYKPKENTA